MVAPRDCDVRRMNVNSGDVATWLGRDPGRRCVVIAEVAQTHDGSLGSAHAFIDAIAATDADAVKFQTHIAAAESTPAETWRTEFSMQDESRYDYWRRMEFSADDWRGLKTHAEERGLAFLASPFSVEAVELLVEVGVPAWKLASGELTDTPVITAMLATGLPVLASSGMSGWAELDQFVATLREATTPFALMQCTSAYPCRPEQVGLNVMDEMRERYACPVGLSDHSGTIFPALAGATLGAEVVEVHVTLSRDMFGPDVPVSVTIDELGDLVDGVRFIDRMRAHPVDKDVAAAELEPMRQLFTKSVVARRDLPAGAVLTSGDLTTKKPGTGLPPADLPRLVGRVLRCAVRTDELLTEDHLERA